METLARYLTVDEAAESLREIAAELGVGEFARIRNLEYVLPPFELVPLAPRVDLPLPRIAALAMDMDGSSTTTEPLALHALEYMVRRITGRPTAEAWGGLDVRLDHPHVIGSSNFRHTEFLLRRYREHVRPAAFTQAFVEAVCWTLACMYDPQRRRDVAQNARNCGLGPLLDDDEFRRLVRSKTVDLESLPRLVEPFVIRYGPAFHAAHESEQVAAALDVYYMRYHSILQRLQQDEGERVAREIFGAGGRALVEPMPGYDVLLPLVKGWLGDEIDALFEPLRQYLLDHPAVEHGRVELDAARPRLRRLAAHFRARPAKVALVTASIAYEAQACMKEVMRVVAGRVQAWGVPAGSRARLAERLADYRGVFDAFVTASDACEPRLKPHRDLYSLALFRMAIPRAEYGCCLGLEDTEPGIIALRAAGIGCAVALPNRDTSGQDYTAATEVIKGGLPELMLMRNLLLS